MTRSEKIRAILGGANRPLSLFELLNLMGEDKSNASSVASKLTYMIGKGSIRTMDGICPSTGRANVQLYWDLGNAMAGAHAARAQAARDGLNMKQAADDLRRAQAAKSRRDQRAHARAQRTTSRADTRTKTREAGFSEAQKTRADAKRAAHEKARQARHTAQKIAGLARARLTFEKLTGCEERDFVVMKAAYRKAALLLHPDRPLGDHEKFAELSAAWALIEMGNIA